MNELQAFETRKRGIDMFYPNGFHEVVERGIELASYIFSELNLSREAAAQASILALYDVVILLDNDSLSMPTQQDRANISILKNAVQIIARLFSFKTAGAKGGIRRLFFINSADEHEHTYITADEIQRLLYKPHLTKPKSTENVLYRNILSPLLYQRDQSQERSQERPMLIILLNFGSLAAEPSNGVSSASILSSSVTDVLSKKVGNGPASIIYQFLQIGNNEAEKRLTDQLARLPAPAGDYINTHHVGPELLYNGEQSPSEAVVSVITFLLNALSGGENTWPSQEEASLPLSRQPTNEGNIQEDINTFEDYSGLGFSVAFSSDGQLLASGSRDQTVRLWSVQRHEAINSFVGHSSVVNSVEFSPDAQLLASGSGDQTIWLWSVQRQQAIHTFQGHSNSVNSVAFSPDAQLLASGSDDRTVRLWSVQRHEVIHTFEGHSNSVNSVAFSPDGQLLASGSGDRTVRLWSVQRHEVVHTFEGHSDSVNSVAFSPDAQLLASGSGDRTVRLWSVQRHEVIHTFEGHSDSVNSVAFSPDGQLLASGSGDRTVRLWSLLRQEVAHTFEGHRDRLALAPEDQLLASGLLSVAFSPDGQLLASGDNNTIFVWQVVHGQYLGLRASTNSNRLALAKVNIQGAAGLDPLNLRLLRQHGAVGEPANT
ncbi:WD40-repeat-containing domain protein [Kalaharituber pfeilii]|nr:WD40-repeat-containing domain protein [Kalaharituber pfeilii]